MIELINTSRTSSANPSSFFARWVDHSTWSEWDPDTEWVTLKGPVRAGTYGVMKPRGGPKVKFQIHECEQDHVYTDVSRMPGMKLTFQHTVSASEAGSELSIRVWLEGPLARLWAQTAFKEFGAGAAASLDRLISLVEAETPAPHPTKMA